MTLGWRGKSSWLGTCGWSDRVTTCSVPDKAHDLDWPLSPSGLRSQSQDCQPRSMPLRRSHAELAVTTQSTHRQTRQTHLEPQGRDRTISRAAARRPTGRCRRRARRAAFEAGLAAYAEATSSSPTSCSSRRGWARATCPSASSSRASSSSRRRSSTTRAGTRPGSRRTSAALAPGSPAQAPAGAGSSRVDVPALIEAIDAKAGGTGARVGDPAIGIPRLPPRDLAAQPPRRRGYPSGRAPSPRAASLRRSRHSLIWVRWLNAQPTITRITKLPVPTPAAAR